MQANIVDGVYLRVGGDAGKTNGLPWHVLEEIGDHLQELIILLAKYDLDSKVSPKLKDFEIELFDFKPGSAVPAFRLAQRNLELFPFEGNSIKSIVANKFDYLMSLANTGNYDELETIYSLDEVRTQIAAELYGLTISADNSPISIVKPEKVKETIIYTPIYNISRFNKQQTERLIKSKKRKTADESPSIEVFGKILLPSSTRYGRKRKIVELYEGKDTTLSIAPPNIVTLDRVYHLYEPLVCKVEKEDDYYVIQAPLLDLFAAGTTIDSAELNFYNEFDLAFKRFNELNDDQLSDRLLRAKKAINLLVKEITKD